MHFQSFKIVLKLIELCKTYPLPYKWPPTSSSLPPPNPGSATATECKQWSSNDTALSSDYIHRL